MGTLALFPPGASLLHIAVILLCVQACVLSLFPSSTVGQIGLGYIASSSGPSRIPCVCLQSLLCLDAPLCPGAAGTPRRGGSAENLRRLILRPCPAWLFVTARLD